MGFPPTTNHFPANPALIFRLHKKDIFPPMKLNIVCRVYFRKRQKNSSGNIYVYSCQKVYQITNISPRCVYVTFL